MHGLLHPCDVEFDRLYDKLDRTLKNLLVDDADETGIHDFETDFLIPLSDDTLELRRSKIKTKFLHTATRLRQWLKISKIKRCHKQRHGLYHYGSSQWACLLMKVRA